MSKICSLIVSLLFLFTVLFFALLPFALIWQIGSKDVFTCKHIPPRQTICQNHSWRLFGLRYQATEWQLQGVRVVEYHDDMGDSYHLSLTTSRGEVNLPYYLDDRKQAYQDLAQFHELLQGSFQSSFHLKRDYSLFTNLLTFVVAVIIFMFFWGIPLLILYGCVRSLTQSN